MKVVLNFSLVYIRGERYLFATGLESVKYQRMKSSMSTLVSDSY